MEEEKTCFNCKYFMQHYANFGGGLIKTGCGHCMIKKISAKNLAIHCCDKWEKAELSIADRKKQFNYQLKWLIRNLMVINILIDEIYGNQQ